MDEVARARQGKRVMPKIKPLSKENLDVVEIRIEVTKALVASIGEDINGHVPAPTIDRWLKLDRALYSFAADFHEC